MRFLAIVLVGCGAQTAALDRRMDLLEQRQTAVESTSGTPSVGEDPRVQDLVDRLGRLETENARLRALVGRITDGAPSNADTLAKAAARHDLIVSAMNYNDVGKSRWFCSSFLCFREKPVCEAVEARTAEPGKQPDECFARGTAFCRGIGKPLAGARANGQKDFPQLMTCHIGIDTCQKWAAKFGGDCVGVE